MHEVLEQQLVPNDLRMFRSREASFQSIVESIDECALYCLDPDGHVVTWNDRAERIEGYPAAQVLRRHVSCLYSAEEHGLDKAAAHVRRAKENGRCQADVRRRRSDGSVFAARVVLTALHDDQGQMLGFAHMTRDLTENKQAESALHLSERLLDGFFSSSPAGLAILDRDLRFQRVNETLAVINGASKQAHLGRTVREVIPALADQVEPHMERVLATGKKTVNHELCGPMPSEEGEIGHWVANYFPIRGESGEIDQIGCVVLDITDCRRAEKSLRRLTGRLMELQDQERRRIARELHDSIGQCLTAIKINLDLLDLDLTDSELSPRSSKALAEALKLSEQCSADTRTISYLLHPPLLDERGLASAIRWYAEGFAQRSGIRLSMDLPTEDVRLPQALETTLFRIVQESLTNIHRHAGTETAEIRLLPDAENVVLEVRDEGHGMPAASLQRCNGTAHQLGVGITGMRERVRQFGGTLEIQSASRGTTVRATLPIGGEA